MHATLHNWYDGRKVLAFRSLLEAMNGLRVLRPAVTFTAFSFKTCRMTGFVGGRPAYYIQLHWE